jgi:hypothetical protein
MPRHFGISDSELDRCDSSYPGLSLECHWYLCVCCRVHYGCAQIQGYYRGSRLKQKKVQSIRLSGTFVTTRGTTGTCNLETPHLASPMLGSVHTLCEALVLDEMRKQMET